MTDIVKRTTFEHANPILRVEDMARSLRYYVDVLGFANEDWSGDEFACVTRDGASIYLSLGDQGIPAHGSGSAWATSKTSTTSTFRVARPSGSRRSASRGRSK